MGGSSGMMISRVGAWVVVSCMVVIMSAPLIAESALSCGMVVSSLSPCISYLRSGGAVPLPCCSGVQTLYSSATTPTDRQTACQCMKSAASSISNINLAFAAALPSKCGVNVPYKISPSTDCSKIQ